MCAKICICGKVSSMRWGYLPADGFMSRLGLTLDLCSSLHSRNFPRAVGEMMVVAIPAGLQPNSHL